MLMDAVTHAITAVDIGMTDAGQTLAILPKDGKNIDHLLKIIV